MLIIQADSPKRKSKISVFLSAQHQLYKFSNLKTYIVPLFDGTLQPCAKVLQLLRDTGLLRLPVLVFALDLGEFLHVFGQLKLSVNLTKLKREICRILQWALSG